MKANKLALATAMVALATCQTLGAEVIEAIAGQCGLDNNSVQAIADEVMAAKAVAETDMNNSKFIHQIPVRSGSCDNELY